MADPANEFGAVQRAFSKQAEHYDEDDLANPILLAWRKQVYDHVKSYLKPIDSILELNSGTGIDALYFARLGNQVLATDYSHGMIDQIQAKITREHIEDRLSCRLCSFESLAEITEKKFDYVFSNFGGLNCSSDLSRITTQLPSLVSPGGFVTLVIMPPVCPWELARVFKGKHDTFRRLRKGGTMAHLEGEYFKTYYYSLPYLKRKIGKEFLFVKTEGLGTFAPPPSAVEFVNRNPKITSVLRWLDRLSRNIFPFNRWGDHIIVTFQYKG